MARSKNPFSDCPKTPAGAGGGHGEGLAIAVLAGERPGGDGIGRAEGVAAKVLVDIDGVPMLQRVLDMLGQLGGGNALYLCGPGRSTLEATGWLARRVAAGAVRWQPPEPSPARSAAALVDAAFAATPAPAGLLLTTGDHPLLRAETVERFVAAAAATGAAVVVGLARHQTVQAAFPESRRTALRLADGPFCGCNLFYFRGPSGGVVLDFWRRMEADRKRPWRMAVTLGPLTTLRYLSGRLTSTAALARLSRRTGVTVAAVEVTDPDAAVDVDSPQDLATVRARWQARVGSA